MILKPKKKKKKTDNHPTFPFPSSPYRWESLELPNKSKKKRGRENIFEISKKKLES